MPLENKKPSLQFRRLGILDLTGRQDLAITA
jgi:hypothetical protein